VKFDTIAGPHTLATTTFYVVTGSISSTMTSAPPKMATLTSCSRPAQLERRSG
jgi:hypothetical protein